MEPRHKAVSLISGGLDSTVLAYNLMDSGWDVHLLSVNYGQRHKRELEFAQRTAAALKVEHRIVDLTSLNQLLQGSALTDAAVDVPHGHYAADNMAITVVPNRNSILLAIATGWAVSLGAKRVAFAAHSGDHAIYPDCRPEFVSALNAAERLANEGFADEDFRIFGPYLNVTKAEIVALGHALRVPFVDTWSCYEGGEIHCGKCGTCVERAEAFALAGVNDPTEYMEPDFWKTALKA